MELLACFHGLLNVLNGSKIEVFVISNIDCAEISTETLKNIPEKILVELLSCSRSLLDVSGWFED